MSVVARVWRLMRRFLSPRWIVVHVVILALVVTMVLLGRWQLNVSNSKHFNLQNFGYALQWWAFTGAALFFWVRFIHHAIRPPAPHSSGTGVALRRAPGEVSRAGPAELTATRLGQEPVVYRGYVIPNSATTPTRSGGDVYHESYNDYLWQLSLADSADVAAQTSLRAAPAADAAPAEPTVVEQPYSD